VQQPDRCDDVAEHGGAGRRHPVGAPGYHRPGRQRDPVDRLRRRRQHTAPPAPSDLQLTGGGESPNLTATWTNPPADAGSPWASADWSACPTSGGACTTGTGTLDADTGTAPATLPAAGTYTVRVWLTDLAGNTNPANGASDTITYTPPALPDPPNPVGGGGDGGGTGGGGGGGGTQPAAKDPRPSTRR
jgi:hypothetical protein